MKKNRPISSKQLSANPLKVEETRKAYTGRLLVRLDPKASTAAVIKQAHAAGLNLTVTTDGVLGEADGVVFERLKVAVISEGGASKVEQLLAGKGGFLSVEPERRLRAVHAAAKGRGKGPLFKDGAAATWGIQAVNILGSKLTGKGVKLAVLDTGFDFMHPDFTGRTIHRKSFTGTRQAQDREGHGTHCAGIAAGGRKGAAGTRYGVAPGVRLYVGKILNDDGEGTDGQALAGIEWALEKGCQVVSMSLGAQVEEGQGYSEVYEQAAQTALLHKCLLLGAAGNESDREEGVIARVNHPANCPGIIAVGGLTQSLKAGNYSTEGPGPGFGQVDIAAPGDDIYSAKPGGKYQRQSGTSMATAFVAGVAALLWERHPDASASEIWVKLSQQARRLDLSSAAVGVGLAGLGEKE